MHLLRTADCERGVISNKSCSKASLLATAATAWRSAGRLEFPALKTVFSHHHRKLSCITQGFQIYMDFQLIFVSLSKNESPSVDLL